jgi:hypothetical protein
MTTLDFERSSISFAAESARTLEELVKWSGWQRNGVPPSTSRGAQAGGDVSRSKSRA